jgi:hypothetical protein
VARVALAGRRRHAEAVVAVLLAAAVATGCGVPNDYAATERTTGGSVNVDSGPLGLRHLRVVLDDRLQAGVVSPVLRGSFVNSGDRADELLRVTSPVAETARLSGRDARLSQTVPLAAGSVVRLEHLTDPGWVFEGAGRELLPGRSVPVTFHFAHEGRVTVTVPVTAG